MGHTAERTESNCIAPLLPPNKNNLLMFTSYDIHIYIHCFLLWYGYLCFWFIHSMRFRGICAREDANAEGTCSQAFAYARFRNIIAWDLFCTDCMFTRATQRRGARRRGARGRPPRLPGERCFRTVRATAASAVGPGAGGGGGEGGKNRNERTPQRKRQGNIIAL